MPTNTAYHLEAHKGHSYAAVEVVNDKYVGFAYRQYIGTKLNKPLEAGKTYYVSLFYSMANEMSGANEMNHCFRTDSLGVYFSRDSLVKNPGCLPMQIIPQVHADSKQIKVSDKWQELTGCYVATGGERFINIGNYATNDLSNCNPIDTVGYYMFIDDVTITPKLVKQFDTLLCNGKPLPINGEKLREEYNYLENWQYKWDDGVTGNERVLTQPGKYTLRVVKDCFEDVYTFNVATGDCICHDYTPTAFTPNGDNVNDGFSPHIICQSGEVNDYKFYVYNRWGQRVFYSTKAGERWNGTFNGHKAPAGAYVYMVRYKSRSGAVDEFKVAKGVILVIR